MSDQFKEIKSIFGLTKAQTRTILNNIENIEHFKVFAQLLDDGHQKPFAKLVIRDGEFATSFIRCDVKKLSAFYDDNWLIIDGMYKRSKLSKCKR